MRRNIVEPVSANIMKTLLYVFTTVLCGVYCLEDKSATDKKLFHAFLEEIYGNGYRMESFIDLMWPKIQEVVPESVTLPGVEFYNIDTDEFKCATETEVSAKLGQIISKKVLLRSKEKVTFEVEAELFLDGKPVEFSIAKALVPNLVSPAEPVSYTFKGPNKAKLVLEIFNFLGKRNILIPQCLVRIKNIMAEEVSRPVYKSEVTDINSKRTQSDFFQSLSDDLAVEVYVTVGLVKAVNDRLGNSWICSSIFFKNVQEGYKKEWEYTQNYYKYCLNKDKH